MGFYNVQQGDVPYLKSLADSYEPRRQRDENPNAKPGTNNYYIQDGYGAGSCGRPHSDHRQASPAV